MTGPERPESDAPILPVIAALAVSLATLSDRTARQVLDVLAAAVAGELELELVPELVAVLAELGGNQAGTLTVGALSAELAEVVGIDSEDLPDMAAAIGLVNSAAVESAAATVLDGPPEQYADRLARLARSVVSRAGQDAREAAIRESPLVEGWVRGLDSDSCQLCIWWWREGRVWPKQHHMPRHPGCNCIQLPELGRNLKVGKSAQNESAERRELDARGEYLDAFGTDRRHNKPRPRRPSSQ